MSRAVKVGIFIVGGIALFCAGLFLIGTSSQLFGHHFTVYTQFSNIDTLVTGATVRVGGMDAGQLKKITVPSGPNSQFRLQLSVDRKFRPIVRQDSIASIETEGMVGNIYVNLSPGSASSPECNRCTLRSQEPVSMGALMREGGQLAQQMKSTLSDLHHRADTIMQNIAGASGRANTMLAAAQPNVIRLTKNASAIVAGIRQGRGAAGKLLTDKTVADNLSATIANARKTTANLRQTSTRVKTMIAQVQKSDLPAVHQTLANAQSMTRRMNQAVGTVLARGNNSEGTAESLRDTLHQAQRTTTNMADDTDALKHNFFFRGFFHRRGFFDLQTLTPAKYARSRFVRKPTARVWVPAAGLFQVGPHGAQELTPEGQAILDRSMSALVPYLPNNPIVIEGYADTGLPDEEYVDSRERAVAVRQYLEKRFHLQSNRVGMMPLGDQPPPQTGRKDWDGVCLVLVAWKK